MNTGGIRISRFRRSLKLDTKPANRTMRLSRQTTRQTTRQTRRRGKISPIYGVLLLLLGAVLSSGCATGGGALNLPSVGPVLSSDFGKTDAALATAHLPGIDVVVPAFDPNIPEDSDTWEKKGIYPELRRAESNRFALKMKSSLEDTDAFGTVRVVPSIAVTGDLYIIGKILESNGEDVKINISATDISGKEWFSKDFQHRVKERFHNNIRNTGKDPYAPVFEEAAAYVVKQLKKRDAEELARLQRISEIRFGTSLSEESFARYLKGGNGRIDLAAAPADDDPALQRIQPIRVRHQLFIDRMQTHYADFNGKLDKSYLVWQQQSLVEVKAARKAKRSAIAKGILGGLLVVAGAAASREDTVLGDVAAVGGILGGVAVLGSAWQGRGEMKVHREALAELGKSIDIEVAPQVVEYENQTAKLEGDSAEQYKQWIAFLKKIYELEATPVKQL